MKHFSKNSVASAAFVLAGIAGSAQAYQHLWDLKDGDEQYQLLKPHEDFIKMMKNKDGNSCCSLRDGRGNMEERINEGPDKDKFPYIVILTHDLIGRELPSPFFLKIHKDSILTVSAAKAICKPERIANKDSTCIAPAFNVLWAYDNSTWAGVRTLEKPYEVTKVFCYFPKPNLE